MTSKMSLSEVNGLKLARFAVQPGRALTLTLFGPREESDARYSYSEVVLQFNRIQEFEIAGTLKVGQGLIAKNAVTEVGSGNGASRTRNYVVSFDSATIKLRAKDYVCWLVTDSKLSEQENKALRQTRGARTAASRKRK